FVDIKLHANKRQAVVVVRGGEVRQDVSIEIWLNSNSAIEKRYDLLPIGANAPQVIRSIFGTAIGIEIVVSHVDLCIPDVDNTNEEERSEQTVKGAKLKGIEVLAFGRNRPSNPECCDRRNENGTMMVRVSVNQNIKSN